MRVFNYWRQKLNHAANQGGIALFMVLSAIAVLFMVIFEFSYVVSVNQRLASDGLDQVKVQYLAETGLKISLLRLKAYQNVKGALGSMGGTSAVPKGMLDKIWSFPFMYPIPAELPGLSMMQKDAITKFTKESRVEGNFTAVIESESSKLNLNSVLAPFASLPAAPDSGKGTNKGSETGKGTAEPPKFDPAAARQSLTDYLQSTLDRKFEEDPDFAAEYRDFRLDDFTDGLFAWVDRTYQRRTSPPHELLQPKGAPFYSLNELRLIEPLDDKLFDVIAPTLTVAPTPGLNVNTMQEPVLRALVAGIRDEEVKDFFEFRDSTKEDNLFKAEGDFFKYLQNSVGRFHNDAAEIKRFKDELRKRGIKIVVDETAFKITVSATVGRATRTLEAYVQLTSGTSGGGSDSGAAAGGGATPPPPALPPSNITDPSKPDPGLRITFMRIS